MDGVFMKKLIKLVIFGVLICSLLGITDLWKDKKLLQDNLIRLHVVANSDSADDQQIKLQVKDAIVNYLQPVMENFSSKEAAMAYVKENLTALQAVANRALDTLGVTDRAKVSFQPEEFLTRVYETFSLPAGVYDALRIEIGDAEGENWWCVVFPSLCLPATSDGFTDTAVSAGFSDTLTNTLTGQEGYHLRFFFLDCLGRLQNLFY